MSYQYPLPAGYPPPGATYQDEQPPLSAGPIAPSPQVGPQQSPGFVYIPAGQPPPPGGVYVYYPQGPPPQGQVHYAGYATPSIPGEGDHLPVAAGLPYAAQPAAGHHPLATPPVTHPPAAVVAQADPCDPVILAETRKPAAVAQVVSEVKHEAVAAAVIVEAAVNMDSRTFYIISEHNDKCVIDIHKDNPKAGATIGIYKRKPAPAPNQLWYLDEAGFLRSKLNGMAIGVEGKDKDCKTTPFTGDARQKWVIEGQKIVNKVFCDECLTIKKSLVRVKDDAEIIAAHYEGSPLQHWKIEHCEMK
jgi:hypothetical protein